MSVAPRPRSLALSLLFAVACGRDEIVGTETGTGSSSTSTGDPGTTASPTSTPTTTSPGTTTDPTGDTGTGTGTGTTTGTSDPGTGTSTTTGTSSGSTSSSGSGSESGTDTGGADCCVASDAPGCGDMQVATCVCADEPVCCVDAWSPGCVAKVDLLACGDCGGPPPKGECCEEGVVPGCSDPLVELCVCEQMPECCSDVWTPACAAAVESLGCGGCGPGFEACCEVQVTPGCPSPEIQACVCAQDSFCCEQTWDDICVGEVDALGCGMCPVPPGPCCEAGGGLGCEDPGVTDCVCAAMPSCCDTQWTAECAAMVEPLGCATCPSTCCVVHDTPSCEDQAVTDCVCAQDEFCCTDSWDAICVSEVESLGCGVCQ